MPQLVAFIVIGILICVGIKSTQGSDTKEERHGHWVDDFCKTPDLDEVFSSDFDPYGTKSGGYFLPMSSHGDLQISENLLGSNNSTCIRFSASDADLTVVTFAAAAGIQSSYFSCVIPFPGKALYRCKHLHAEGEQDLSHIAWRSLTDYETFGFVTRCFPKIRKEAWVVFSKNSRLSPRVIAQIKRHVRSLDYDPLDFCFRDYTSCPTVCLA